MMWKKLAPLFGSADPNFEKKARSILYDLTAGIVVLPSGTSRLPQGRRLAVRRIDQTGYPLMMSKMDHFLFTSLLQSILLLAYVLTLVLMTLMRRSLPLGLISTLPIIFTSVVMFGLLALIGVPLDYATMMIGGVSIGVGIDYAIHFIHGYIGELDAGYHRRRGDPPRLPGQGQGHPDQRPVGHGRVRRAAPLLAAAAAQFRLGHGLLDVPGRRGGADAAPGRHPGLQSQDQKIKGGKYA